MSGVGITFNPMDIMSYQQNKNVLNNQIYQQRVDNQFRNTQFQENRSWNWRMWNDRKFQIQNLVKDAQAAGVSPLAALGAGGQSPANINVPVGQGGRAAGRFQSSGQGITVQMQGLIHRQQKAETKKAEAEAVSSELDNLVKIGVIKPEPQPIPTPLPIANTTQDYYDPNLGRLQYISPEFAESLDSLGGYLYHLMSTGYKNVREFWDDSKYFRNEMMNKKR